MTEASLFKMLQGALDGKPLDDVGPALVVAVARALVLDAGGDLDRLGWLILKFNAHLHETIDSMIEPPGGATLQ